VDDTGTHPHSGTGAAGDTAGDTADAGTGASTGGAAGVGVTVRYFAGARAAAGTPEESVTLAGEATVAGLIDALVDRHGDRLARVLAASAFLVDEIAGGPERPLRNGTQVDVLPPFAGG
jgi:molybdopterin synthase sulfur carrier subunit